MYFLIHFFEAWFCPRFVAWFFYSLGGPPHRLSVFLVLALLMDVDGNPVTLAKTS